VQLPEPGRAIKEAERGGLEAERNKQKQRPTGSATGTGSLACRMRPHDPGVADRKKEQGEAAHSETKPGTWLAHQRSQRKEEAHEPEVLVKPPEMEGDTTLCNHVTIRLDSLLARVSLSSQWVIVS